MNTKPFEFFLKINHFIVNPIYLQGVPNLDESFSVEFLPVRGGVKILDRKTRKEKLFLSKEDIIRFSIEDQSTIGERIGFKRLLLVGVFALAWKKRTTIPLSFLIIDYKDKYGNENEMYIQSEQQEGFQFFTNVKYNLQRCWEEFTLNSDAEIILNRLYKAENNNKKQASKGFAIGCISVIILSILIILFVRK